MESNIKKQASIYGLAAILIATILTAIIFNSNVIRLGYEPGDPPAPAPESQLLSSFQSEEELKNFLETNSKVQGPFWISGPVDAMFFNHEYPSCGSR